MIGRYSKKVSFVRYRFLLRCISNTAGSMLDHGNLVDTGHSDRTNFCGNICLAMVEKSKRWQLVIIGNTAIGGSR